MDARQFFTQALKTGGTCLPHITTGELANATPCTAWNLRQLLNHMVYELRWLPEIVAGKTIAEVGDRYDGDLLGEDMQKAWREAAEAAAAAAKRAKLDDTAHLSYGDVPMEKYLTESGCDMLIHGWDVGHAINCTLQFPAEVAQAAFDYYRPRAKKEGIPGIFGPRVEVPATADLQTKLLALVGRKA